LATASRLRTAATQAGNATFGGASLSALTRPMSDFMNATATSIRPYFSALLTTLRDTSTKTSSRGSSDLTNLRPSSAESQRAFSGQRAQASPRDLRAHSTHVPVSSHMSRPGMANPQEGHMATPPLGRSLT
jgi:hypothetical protein